MNFFCLINVHVTKQSHKWQIASAQ
jgi:hypothetical protein